MGFRPNSLRLNGFDYKQPSMYYVTICTHNREYIFGEIENSTMALSDLGKVVHSCWVDLPNHYPEIEIKEFVIMPNHIHGIILIKDHNSEINPSNLYGLTEIIRGFKTFSAKEINAIRKTKGFSVWQRGFHDRIIRGKDELDRIKKYVLDNPKNWPSDKEYLTD
jgi:putative transposase